MNHQSKTRLIDSNIKIEAMQKEALENELKFKKLMTETSETEFVSGINVQEVSYVEPEIAIEAAQTTAIKIIEDANLKVKTIIEEAETERKILYERTFQEAKTDGYREGAIAAQLEYDQKVTGWEQKIQQAQDEYEEKIDQLEPLIVDTLLEVMEKVLEIQITDKREIILALIRKSILHIDNTKEFRVFLNQTQLEYLNEHFQRFQKELGQGKAVDCFSDDSLMDEQCRIETDFGTYHCGFDTYFKNLVKEIKTLSI